VLTFFLLSSGNPFFIVLLNEETKNDHHERNVTMKKFILSLVIMGLGVIMVLGVLMAVAISSSAPDNSLFGMEVIVLVVGITATVYGAIFSFIEAKK